MTAAQRRKVLGDAWVDKSIANKNSFNAKFLDLITRHAWGEIWTRPHFDQRTRRVLVIGTMVVLGQWDEFRLHVRAALAEGGFTPDDIKEILLQQAIYCGVPAANHAVKDGISDCSGAGPAQGLARRQSCCDRLAPEPAAAEREVRPARQSRCRAASTIRSHAA
jgi:4-carboxymuconolactone decarboxylase